MNWWSNFRLLMWKNFLIKSRHKVELAVEIILPLVFICALLGIRVAAFPTIFSDPTVYQPVSIGVNNLEELRIEYASTVLQWQIDYTPVNPVLTKLVSDAAAQLNLNISGFNSTADLEEHMTLSKAFVGVVFEVTDELSLPKNFTYSIRFPGALRTVSEMATISTWDTHTLFPSNIDFLGPRLRNSSAGGNPSYINEGFIAVQNAVSSSFIKLVANSSTQLPAIELQRFPYPPYVFDPLIQSMKQSAGIMIVLAFLFPCVQFIKHITVEKHKQLKEAMKIMGLSSALHWTAWFVTMMSVLLIIVVVLLILLRVHWFNDYTVGVFVNSSWTLLLVTFLIYSVSAVTFSFMFSSFFTKATIAGPISALAWFITYIPFAFTANTGSFPFVGTVIISIFLNSALPVACSVIFSWEGVGVGAQWSNLFEFPPDGTNCSLGVSLVMMVMDGIVYMLVSLYIEKIMPGSYGTAYKWYFLFTKSFWVSNQKNVEESDEPPLSPGMDDDRFESEFGNLNNVGIRLVNLRKKFGDKTAVDGLSMKMYENQITVLLGHNGAGKTTAISMITGLIMPTSGTAIVNGYNTLKNFTEIRKSLGFCPQYNILFDELTVEEHIVFYALLKGVPKIDIQNEVDKYLKILGLEDKRKCQSAQLSGGMKRKLSVGIALCGDSKFVLCDEPSAGMDPAARRALWQLLQGEKKGRTILLTTHLMDEADVLGDRIAIMAEGKLTCSGTPFFLKKRFGTGYKLICSKQPNCQTQPVTNLIQEYIPNVAIKSQVGMELTYELPEEYSKVFGPMLNRLENSQESLGLNGYGISMTTLEDVFLKTGTEIVQHNGKANDSLNGNGSSIHIESFNIDNIEIVSPGRRAMYQWEAMFFKRFVNFIRHWYLFVIQVAVPIIFIILGWLIAEAINVDNSLPQLPIDLNEYGRTVTLLRDESNAGSLSSRIAESYKNMFKTFPARDELNVVTEPIEEALLSLGDKDIWSVDKYYMVAATIWPNRTIGWFNNQALHTAPLTLNLIYNAIVRTILGSDYHINVINDPLPLSSNRELKQLQETGSLGFQLAVNTTFAMAYVSSIFIMFLITERVSRSKLLQMVSGARLGVFWAVHFLWDFLTYCVIACLVVLVMFILQQEGFRTGPELGQLFLVFIVYGFATLPFTYLVSFYFEEPATGLARLSLIQVFTGDALFIVSFVLNVVGSGDFLQNVAIIFPNFALAQAISNQATLESSRQVCSTISRQLHLSMAEICEIVSKECCYIDAFGWKNPGIGKILVCMFGVGCGLFLILMLKERRSIQPSNSCCTRVPSLPSESPSEFDDDVANEKLRIAQMQGHEIVQRKIVVKDLTKFYKKFLAVNRVSLAVDRGECFGLLGVNGAGKTSAFKMMAGDEVISHGDVWVNGKHVKDDLYSIYEYIGYCPQYDALLMDFTGMEMMKLFASLRGVPKDLIDPLCDELATRLAFKQHLHKKVGDYSGGNRRKLSTAVALLGNPHVVYLDEPTAGIDPASRRKLWDMVCHFRDLGQAVILTSHSMEECEALCTRIAIMVNGEFKCIGSSQHLKNKYSPERSLSIKLGRSHSNKNSPVLSNGHSDTPAFNLDDNGQRVFQFVNDNLIGAKLKDCHKNLLTFELPGNTMQYSQIFDLMESNKVALGIEDYSLSQGTLEQVFLSFAQNQRQS